MVNGLPFKTIGDDVVDHLTGYVRHCYQVGDVSEWSQLPLVQHVWRRTRKDDGRAVLPAPGGNAVGVELPDCVLRGVEHLRHNAPKAVLSVLGQGIPDNHRGEGVARAKERGVQSPHVFDSAPNSGRVLAPGDDNAAGNGRTDHFVARNGDAVDATVEPEGLRIIDEGEDHATERSVGVDVGAGERQILEDAPDFVEVIHGSLHGGADVGHYQRRLIPIDENGLAQVVVVHLAVILAADHDVPHIQDVQDFEHRIVGVL